MVSQNLHELIYQKDMRIQGLENRIQRISRSLENVIDARLYEKGNQLIYDLDSCRRVLSLFKTSVYDLEQTLVSKILGEQLEKFDRLRNQKMMGEIKYEKYRETIMNKINENFVEDIDRIKKAIHEKAEKAKNTEEGQARNEVSLYPLASASNAHTDQ